MKYNIWKWLLSRASSGTSEQDAEQVTEPVPAPIKPVKEEVPQRIARTLLVLDAGHYKETAGKRGPNFPPQSIEWLDNRYFTTLLYNTIQKGNRKIDNPIIDVIVANEDWSKEQEEFVTGRDMSHLHTNGKEKLYYRKEKINRIYNANVPHYKNILFISIHHNAASSSKPRGLEVYYHGLGDNYTSKLFAKTISTWFALGNFTVRPYTYRPDTWIYKSGFYLLRNVKFPVKVLIEVAYMTNKQDVLEIKNDKIVQRKCDLIYAAIKDFINE